MAANTPSTTTSDSPFLRLPTEIRLEIYALLVLPQEPDELLPAYMKVKRTGRESFDGGRNLMAYDRATIANPFLLIRTMKPLHYKGTIEHPHARPYLRSTYGVKDDGFSRRTVTSTYHGVNIHPMNADLGIMRTNKQIHAECAEVLYGTYTIDFDTHIEAIAPFLSDLTPIARSYIKKIRIVKKALVWETEFDRCEWHTALKYISSPESGLNLRKLELGVVAGTPGENGWSVVASYSASEFGLLKDTERMKWMRDVLMIKGLKELDVYSVVKLCPSGEESMVMTRFILFSASVDRGLAKYLKSQMIQA